MQGGVESAGATVVAYADKSARAPPKLFLDANVILDLLEHETAMGPRKPGQKAVGRSHPDLVGCLARLRAVKTALIVTPAALEEVFHVLSMRLLDSLDAQVACGACAGAKPRAREKALRSHHPSEFAACRKSSVMMLRNALVSLKKHGAGVWLPDGAGASGALGAKVLEAFVALVEGCMHIGGKDALHIATAAILECTAFASRDGGFRHVPNLTVYTQSV